MEGISTNLDILNLLFNNIHQKRQTRVKFIKGYQIESCDLSTEKFYQKVQNRRPPKRKNSHYKIQFFSLI